MTFDLKLVFDTYALRASATGPDAVCLSAIRRKAGEKDEYITIATRTVAETYDYLATNEWAEMGLMKYPEFRRFLRAALALTRPDGAQE